MYKEKAAEEFIIEDSMKIIVKAIKNRVENFRSEASNYIDDAG